MEIIVSAQKAKEDLKAILKELDAELTHDERNEVVKRVKVVTNTYNSYVEDGNIYKIAIARRIIDAIRVQLKEREKLVLELKK